MGTFKGTKGEWGMQEIQKPLSRRKLHTCMVSSTDGLYKPAQVNGETFEECEANAKLIAAAPELLESLKDLIEWANIKDGSPSQYLRDRALSAIKKATE